MHDKTSMRMAAVRTRVEIICICGQQLAYTHARVSHVPVAHTRTHTNTSLGGGWQIAFEQIPIIFTRKRAGNADRPTDRPATALLHFADCTGGDFTSPPVPKTGTVFATCMSLHSQCSGISLSRTTAPPAHVQIHANRRRELGERIKSIYN